MDRIDAVHVFVEVPLCVNEKKGSHHSRDIHVPLQIQSELHRVIHYYRDPSHSVDVDRDRKYPWPCQLSSAHLTWIMYACHVASPH